MRRKFHPFHLVTQSLWPLLISIAAYFTAVGATMYMHSYSFGRFVFFWGFVHVIVIMALWWRDVIREGTFEGMHTKKVQAGLKLGFILFIVSEVMFFFGFFWAFFHSAAMPSIALGSIWPPYAINPFNPFGIPLVNTCLLLLSGVTITYTHHALINHDFYKTYVGFCETIFYATLFTLLQLKEYCDAPFAISDGIFGSVFFLITGLHGVHVIIGTIFIFVCFLRFLEGHFRFKNNIAFDFSVWYWHFVDAIWLFVFLAIYIWGS